jgi:hypothetical protein
MVKENIDYQELKQKIITYLIGKKAIVIATAAQNRVTARTVSFVNIQLELFFWSYKNHTKCYQIEENQRVALCRDILQIEGIATLNGSILDKKNKEYLLPYKTRFPKKYVRYLNDSSLILISVIPTLCILLVYIDGMVYRDHLDLIKKYAFRVELRE